VRDTRKKYDDALRDLAKCLHCDNIKFDEWELQLFGIVIFLDSIFAANYEVG
jgi:hypothetical protein